jgi:hypothetical protein
MAFSDLMMGALGTAAVSNRLFEGTRGETVVFPLASSLASPVFCPADCSALTVACGVEFEFTKL